MFDRYGSLRHHFFSGDVGIAVRPHIGLHN
jgi:hypothetical protein